MDDAAEAVADVVQSGVDVAKLELVDPLAAEMANDYLDTGLPDGATIFVEFHANHGVDEEIAFFETIVEAHDVETFEIAGDGNIHYTALIDPSDPDEIERGQQLYSDIVDRAIEVDGTATGEHGIGMGKRRFLELEHGADGVEAMRALKLALDPNDTLNPGKVFPETAEGERVRAGEESPTAAGRDDRNP